MFTQIKGIFRNGHVELDHDPGIEGEASVIVTFLNSSSENTTPKSKIITFGMLGDPNRKMSAEEDFKVAEHDDARWERD